MVVALESAPFSRREESRRVVYDRLELLTPARAPELIADLRARTHLPVERYDVGNVDLLRDTADLLVYYTLPSVDPSADVPFEPAGIRSRSEHGTVA
jgi:hypothetical protein